MSQPAKDSTDVGDSLGPTVGLSFNVMIAAVIFCFILALFFLTLYLYAKHVWALDRSLRRRRSRLIFAASDPVTFHRHGLDAAILRSLPITEFKVDPEEELECAVCLSELSDGEEVRMLPKCNHGFHLECIDMWFHSHSTCPLCRSPVGFPVPVSQGIPTPGAETAESTEATVAIFSETPNGEPATSVSVPNEEPATSVPLSLVIDIPRRVMQGFSSSPSTPLPTSYDYGNPMMGTKPVTPTSARLRTLTRLLSMGKRTMGASSTASPRDIEDIEQGQGLLVGESPRGVTLRIPRNS